MSELSQPVERSGILSGGNWIIDQVKIIDVYPKHEQLANILGQSQGTGGSPYNVLLDLAKMGASFPLEGAGLVGQDALGEFILEDCRKNTIDTQFMSVSPGTSTSYTDVMTEKEGGRRTFFHNSGANSTWDGADIDFSKSKAKIFHLGYLLLLDALDQEDIRSMAPREPPCSPRPELLDSRPVLMWSVKTVTALAGLLARR